MKKIFSESFKSYYRAVFDGLYDLEQRKSLLGLILRSEGIFPESDEYRSAFCAAFDVIESEGIDRSLSSARNFLLICSLDNTEDDNIILKCAAEELEKVLSENGIRNLELENISAVINKPPKNDSERLSRAFKQYSLGNVEGALEDLELLARIGSIRAVKLLGAICLEIGNKERAYYSFSLAESIYRSCLGWSVPTYVSSTLNGLRPSVFGERLDELDMQVENAIRFIMKHERQIGFV